MQLESKFTKNQLGYRNAKSLFQKWKIKSLRINSISISLPREEFGNYEHNKGVEHSRGQGI